METVVEETLSKGLDAHKAGQFVEAAIHYNSVLKNAPKQPDANHNLGVLSVNTGKVLEAMPMLKIALEENPNEAQYWVSYIDALIQLEAIHDAQNMLEQAKERGAQGAPFDNLQQRIKELEENETPKIGALSNSKSLKTPEPDDQDLQVIIKLYTQGELKEALLRANLLFQKFPNSLNLNILLGSINDASGNFEAALASYKKAKEISPRNAAIHKNLADIEKKCGNIQAAMHAYRQAIKINPQYPGALNGLANALAEKGEVQSAIDHYYTAIDIKPYYFEAYNNLGNILRENGEYQAAIKNLQKALKLNPDDARIHNNLGLAFHDFQENDAALDSFKRAIKIDPTYAEALNNMGNTFQAKRDPKSAIECYKKAILFAPKHDDIYNNLANAYKQQSRFKDALKTYQKALQINPQNAEPHYNLGNMFSEQSDYKSAVESYANALELEPNYESARANKLLAHTFLFDWAEIEKNKKLISELGVSDQPIHPFTMLCLEDVPDRHRIRSEAYSSKTCPQKPIPFKSRSSSNQKKLRIGYFSADFRNHAISTLLVKMLSLHDRDKFEIYAYAFGPDKKDEMTDRIINSVDVFRDIRKISDKNAALMARDDAIDIAVDLTGFTKGTRLGIFAYRAAPIQINYLACASSIGADFIDYIVADHFCIPNEYQEFYGESIIYLPNCYQVNDNTREVSERIFTREEMGLPENAFVFCSFNASYKITAEEFDVWMRVLQKVPCSVLWLAKPNSTAQQNLQLEAEKRGISADRLIFAESLPNSEHLARHKLADLFLDTFNFNAGATASDVLWMAQPIITKPGKGFATRVAGSLLKGINVPELITQTTEEYEKLILELALDPERLERTKRKLKKNRLTTPLFNTELFTKHLEDGLTQAHQVFSDKKIKPHIFVER